MRTGGGVEWVGLSVHVADQQDVNIGKVGMLSERDTAYSCKMTKTSTVAIIPGWLEVICSTP